MALGRTVEEMSINSLKELKRLYTKNSKDYSTARAFAMYIGLNTFRQIELMEFRARRGKKQEWENN